LPTIRGVSFNYVQTRRLVLGAGLGVLLIIAGLMYWRRVDTVEVIGVLLFIPVFVAFIAWDIAGGVIAGAAAALVYTVARLPAIEAVGAGRFTSLIVARGIAYLAFGLLGGWADRALEQSLVKLDVYDQIDDQTGLYNARFFVQDTELETARVARYKTIFSVCVVDVPTSLLESLPRRRRAALVRDLGQIIKDGVRSVDRAVFGHDSRYRFAVICPETGPDGARIFVDRMGDRLAEILSQRGVQASPSDILRTPCSVPGDDALLARLREEFAAIERAEHPEHPAASTATTGA
jgi:GGDEF domain-containing protein